MDVGRWLVGQVRAPVSAFVFPSPSRSARTYISENPKVAARRSRAQNQKYRLFMLTRCQPDLDENQIDIMIDHRTLKRILTTLNVSREMLKEKRSPCYQLPDDIKLRCESGRQRIEASRMWGSDFLWTVNLYYAEEQETSLLRTWFTKRAESFSFQAPYLDGDIYMKIRQYQGTEEEANWRARLSPCKADILDMLLSERNGRIAQALNKVMSFPGNRIFLKIGNVHKYIALHCPAQVVSFLDLVYTVLHNAAGRNKLMHQYFDADSILKMQTLVPSRNPKAMERLMHDKDFLAGFTNKEERYMAGQNLLSIDRMIHSLDTFDNNMKYFAIGAKVLRRYIVPEFDSRTMTLFDRLEMCYTSPGEELVEVGFNQFDSIREPRGARLACLVIFLLCLREFPYLTTDSPLQENGERLQGFIDDRYARYLCDTAWRLGFRSEKIAEWRALKVAGFDEKDHPPASLNKRTKIWKGGKPPLVTFRYLRAHAFLPSLASLAGKPPIETISPLFVLNDFINAFFGALPSFALWQKDVTMHETRPDPPLDSGYDFVGDAGVGDAGGPDAGLQRRVEPAHGIGDLQHVPSKRDAGIFAQAPVHADHPRSPVMELDTTGVYDRLYKLQSDAVSREQRSAEQRSAKRRHLKKSQLTELDLPYIRADPVLLRPRMGTPTPASSLDAEYLGTGLKRKYDQSSGQNEHLNMAKMNVSQRGVRGLAGPTGETQETNRPEPIGEEVSLVTEITPSKGLSAREQQLGRPPEMKGEGKSGKLKKLRGTGNDLSENVQPEQGALPPAAQTALGNQHHGTTEQRHPATRPARQASAKSGDQRLKTTVKPIQKSSLKQFQFNPQFEQVVRGAAVSGEASVRSTGRSLTNRALVPPQPSPRTLNAPAKPPHGSSQSRSQPRELTPADPVTQTINLKSAHPPGLVTAASQFAEGSSSTGARSPINTNFISATPSDKPVFSSTSDRFTP